MQAVDTFQTFHDWLADAVKFLPDKPEETPETTLRALWHTAAGAPKSAQLAAQSKLPELNDEGLSTLTRLMQQRIVGAPLAHLSERQQFLGIEMLAGPEALVPRKETELLAQSAVELARNLADRRPEVRVVDVCTGSGNVALAIARRVPAARVCGSDLSPQAVALARRNSAHLGLADRVAFYEGDLLAPFESDDWIGQIDLLTCNPPYISSGKVPRLPAEIADHEPKLAFDGGPFGVSLLIRLVKEAPRFLRTGGWLAFEIGLGQGPALLKRLRASPTFHEISAVCDDTGDVRAIIARRSERPAFPDGDMTCRKSL